MFARLFGMLFVINYLAMDCNKRHVTECGIRCDHISSPELVIQSTTHEIWLMPRMVCWVTYIYDIRLGYVTTSHQLTTYSIIAEWQKITRIYMTMEFSSHPILFKRSRCMHVTVYIVSKHIDIYHAHNHQPTTA